MNTTFPIFTEALFSTNGGVTPMVRLGPVHSNGFAPGFAPDVPPEEFADLICGEGGENIDRAAEQIKAAPPGRSAVFVGGWMFVKKPGHSDQLFRAYCAATYEALRRHAEVFAEEGAWPDFIIADAEPSEEDGGGITRAARLCRQMLFEAVGQTPPLFNADRTGFIGWQLFDADGAQADEYTKPFDPFTVKRKFLLPTKHACVHAYLLPESGPLAGHVPLTKQVDQIIAQAHGAARLGLEWAVLADGYLRYHGNAYASAGDGGWTDAAFRAEYTRMARGLREIQGFRGVWVFPTAGIGHPPMSDPSMAGKYPEHIITADLPMQMRDEAAIVEAWRGA